MLLVFCLLACSSSHGSDGDDESGKDNDEGADAAAADAGAGKSSGEAGDEAEPDAEPEVDAATHGDPSCEELRGCCNAMSGADRGTCLATLSSLETGTRPAADCSSSLDALVEAGSCPCQSASCSCGTASCASGDFCRDGRCAKEAAPDAGSREPDPPQPGSCAMTDEPCTRNIDCCGWPAQQAYCVSLGDQEICLKACKDTTDCSSNELCHPITDLGNSVCAPQ